MSAQLRPGPTTVLPAMTSWFTVALQTTAYETVLA